MQDTVYWKPFFMTYKVDDAGVLSSLLSFPPPPVLFQFLFYPLLR